MKTVVAALILRDSRLLICQRKRGGTFPLKWEFPGGKVEPGEDLERALIRELAEELGSSRGHRPRDLANDLPIPR